MSRFVHVIHVEAPLTSLPPLPPLDELEEELLVGAQASMAGNDPGVTLAVDMLLSS